MYILSISAFWNHYFCWLWFINHK